MSIQEHRRTETELPALDPRLDPEIIKVEKKTGLRGFIETRAGKATVGGAALLAAGALAFGGFKFAESASNSSEQNNSQQEPEVVEPVVTPETPVEQEPIRNQNSDFERVNPLSPELEYLNELSLEEYALEPIETRMQWADWAGQYHDEFVQKFHSVSLAEGDAPYTVSAEDPYTLLADLQYQDRIAENFGTEIPMEDPRSNGPIDLAMAEKYIASYMIGPAVAESARTTASIMGFGQIDAVNVSAQAMLERFEYVEDAKNADDFTVIHTNFHVGDVVYDGYSINYTIPETGDPFVTKLTEIDGHAIRFVQ